MVLTKEYRIPLPVSVDEYKIAQLYMISKFSKQQTGHGEGVEIKENKAYIESDGAGEGIEPPGTPGVESGQYTHKIYHIGSRLPSWLRAIAPSSLQIIEKAWNAYPYCTTVYSCPLLGDRFFITITTRYLADGGDHPNALGLSDQQLKDRAVDIVDIAYDPIDPAKYKVEEDPTLFVSAKTGRGKLQKDWRGNTNPIMTCYKHCEVEFRYWGLQSRIENYIHSSGLRDIFLQGHRQAFCWIDEWFGLNMEDVRKIESKAQEELKALLENSGETNTL